jgi:hypothetical protein
MGIVQLAQKTGVPLFPVGVATSHKYVFKKSWNQAYLTLPFSRQVILVDKPLFFLRTSDPEKREQYRLGVEKALDDARCKAERMLEDWK